MNVSFTRARSKLIVIGSRSTLKSASILADFFDLMDSRAWVLKLPPNADTLHSFTNEGIPVLKKRNAIDMAGDLDAMKENTSHSKRAKKLQKQLQLDGGMLKRRPILQDVLNEVLHN